MYFTFIFHIYTHIYMWKDKNLPLAATKGTYLLLYMSVGYGDCKFVHPF